MNYYKTWKTSVVLNWGTPFILKMPKIERNQVMKMVIITGKNLTQESYIL
ncbi:hypothetical protein ACX0G9_03685 [Flavitalea flava]